MFRAVYYQREKYCRCSCCEKAGKGSGKKNSVVKMCGQKYSFAKLGPLWISAHVFHLLSPSCICEKGISGKIDILATGLTMSLYRFRISNLPRRLARAEGLGSGPQGRINKMRKLITALVRHERIEGKLMYLDEARGYMEELVHHAAKYGDRHQPTMELADYWLLEKDLVPKLFKVLVPRYTNLSGPCTQAHRLPDQLSPGVPGIPMSVLELKGNPWPPVIPQPRNVGNSLVNILLEEARKDYEKSRALKKSKLVEEQTEASAAGD